MIVQLFKKNNLISLQYIVDIQTKDSYVRTWLLLWLGFTIKEGVRLK